MMSDWNDHQPIYLQLKDLVLRQILRGLLPEGEAVPSVRQVAAQERINPITVSKAYQMLVDAELLEKRRGLGMFVCSGAQELALNQERDRFITEQWPEILVTIAALGLDVTTLLADSAQGSS
ncbi:MAG: GntR family transcriptional regulator [Gammaproteobacteria bacterium]|nr:GntR family transcriptional regulator [Gammaproteobacteria bacterium]